MIIGIVMHGLVWLGAENWFHFQGFKKKYHPKFRERKKKRWEKVKENKGFKEEES